MQCIVLYGMYYVCMYATQLRIIPENTAPDLNLKANLILTQLGGEAEARTVKELLPVSQEMGLSENVVYP